MKIKRGFATVTIYRRPHPKTASGFVFTVAWSISGRRYLLQRATLAKAQMEAAAKAEQLAAGRIQVAATMTTDDAAVLAEARKLCREVPVLAALGEWAEARKLCQGPILPAARAYAARGFAPKAATVPDVVKAFMKHKKGRGIDTDASYVHFLPRLAESFTGPMQSISAEMLENWINRTFVSEGNKTVHPSTFNTARKRLVTLWRWARNGRFLPQDALTEAERIHSAKEKAPKREIMTVGDFARCLVLLREKHPEYLASAVLAGFCGLRRDEVHSQLWSDVSLDASKLAVSVAKEGTPEDRLVEIPTAGVDWLKLCKQREGLVAPSWAQDRIRAFCRDATPPIRCPANAFRHSFVSYRVASSGSVAETAIEAGNSSAVIFKHYRRPVTKGDGLAWFGLTPAKAQEIILAVNKGVPNE